MIKFKVPATSANIGPGFDCFGLAFSFCNEYQVEKSNKMFIEGCDPVFNNKNNEFNKAFNATMKILNKKGSYHLYEIPKIPSSRGLGSSASVIVAGCKTANILYGNNKLTNEDIFNISTKIEGHPDNVAAAIFGGLTASVRLNNGKYYCKKYKISNKLYFTALIPDFKTQTQIARKLLPQKYAKNDVISTISHSILMVEALKSGDFNLLKTVCKDCIHEPYRKQLIKDYDNIKKIVEKNGDAVLLISGSGPTLLAISNNASFSNNLILKNTKATWTINPVKIKKGGI